MPSETCCLAPKEKKAKTSCVYVQQVEETPHSGGGAPNSSSPEFQYHHQTSAVAAAGVPATSSPDATTMPPDSAAKDIVEVSFHGPTHHNRDWDPVTSDWCSQHMSLCSWVYHDKQQCASFEKNSPSQKVRLIHAVAAAGNATIVI